jgi:hypothetical protein
MSHFEYERVIGEPAMEAQQVGAVLGRVFERDRELEQERAESVCFRQWVDAGLEFGFVGWGGISLVREAPPELGGVAKVLVLDHVLRP